MTATNTRPDPRVGALKFGIDEWFVVALARTIKDREAVFHGFGSPCAQVAMHVARRTHARNMLLVEGATYAINPDPLFIPPTGNDRALQHSATYQMKFEEFFDAAIRGDITRMFLSGGQIDRWGNTNVTAVGRIGSAPKVKLGGGGGGCNLAATIPHLTLWTTRHGSGRTLVEACDFITDMGHRTPSGTSQELGHTGQGPEWLVTELGVFDFANGAVRLRQLFPDVTVDQVRSATGFDVDVAGDLRRVPLPSSAELAALRAVDPLGVRRQEFSPDQLERAFEHTGGDNCAC